MKKKSVLFCLLAVLAAGLAVFFLSLCATARDPAPFAVRS